MIWQGLSAVFLLLSLVLAVCLFLDRRRVRQRTQELEWLLEDMLDGDHDAHPESLRHLRADRHFARICDRIRELGEILADKEAQNARDKKWLKDLMSDISHQMKTPLAALELYIDIFRKEMRGKDPEVEKLALQAGSAMERIRWLVTGMLKLAQLESGTYVMEKRLLPVRDTLEKSIHALEGMYREKGLKIEIDCPGEEILLLQEPDWLQEAFQNILKNAITYADPGTAITIEIRDTTMSLMISIRDRGEGIPAEELPRIFNRFYRAKRQNGKRGDGVGIGLALARQIVEAHDGSLTAESSCGEDSSTTMIMTFLREVEP
ncbi:MAG: HAMP domain-containing histidine kinase [Lachnospiraceae bacterium]|nr:HAMP domain-containing histidine kinase [Lachnospiraceae bacterium]